MRLYEVIQLNEYQRDITQQKLGDKLVQAAAAHDRKQDIDTILDSIESMDPTRNKKYVDWIIRQYMKKFFKLEDAPRVVETLTAFEDLKRGLANKDINSYTFPQLTQVICNSREVDLDQAPTTEQNAIPGVKVLYQGPLGTLSIPTTRSAAIELGRGGSWCTSRNDDDNEFREYSSPETPLYIWKDKNGKRYQFCWNPENMDFKDIKNKDIAPELINYFRTEHPVLSKLFKQQENAIISIDDPYEVINYAEYVIKGRWPLGEKVIATNPHAASQYAIRVIKGRWPEAEKAIATNPHAASQYAEYVIKGRWPEAEPVIATNPNAASRYAEYVIKGRWPLAEKTITTNPGIAELYNDEFGTNL